MKGREAVWLNRYAASKQATKRKRERSIQAN
jgi:hypothetical protein